MKKVLLPFLRLAKRHAGSFCNLFNITLLSEEQTQKLLYLQAKLLLGEPGENILLAPILVATTNEKLFKENAILTASRYVWELSNEDGKIKLLPSGCIRTRNEVLDLGFGNRAVIRDLLKRSPRQLRTTKILIAPWGHYWTGYYDYLFFVALNLYRIKNTMQPSELAETIVCYPLFNTAFEREILLLIGFEPKDVLDSRTHNVNFETCLVGNNGSWFYPNRVDVLAFKTLIQHTTSFSVPTNDRIYIQRTGRRKVLNEAKLILLLKKYDFSVIEDIPRSFNDQLQLYHSASFIIGPHGASFANILACREGTQLLELFSDTYVPEYFRYLAHILDLRYAAYCNGAPVGSDHRFVQDNITVNLEDLEQQLLHVLPQELN